MLIATIVGTRRAALGAAAAIAVVPAFAFADESAVQALEVQQNLRSLNAGSRRLTSGELEEGDLVKELLRRTEANKERNAAIVKRTTESNAFTAIDGTLDRRLVTGLDGKNRYLDTKQIREMTRERRLACAPSVMEPCREIQPSSDAPPLELPALKQLECDKDGRNCQFR